MTESFMKGFKQEEIYANNYRDLEHLVQSVEAFIEDHYDRSRTEATFWSEPLF
jgi:hypothetical protein